MAARQANEQTNEWMNAGQPTLFSLNSGSFRERGGKCQQRFLRTASATSAPTTESCVFFARTLPPSLLCSPPVCCLWDRESEGSWTSSMQSSAFFTALQMPLLALEGSNHSSSFPDYQDVGEKKLYKWPNWFAHSKQRSDEKHVWEILQRATEAI